MSPLEYIDASVIAQETGQEMLNRLDWMTIRPDIILDIGCAGGEMSGLLGKRYPNAKVLACDISERMICHARAYSPLPLYFCADGAKLPLQAETIDLIFINLTLSWQTNVELLLQECRRLLRQDGLLIFTALGVDTLQEWRQVSSRKLVPQLADMHDIGDLLLQQGFADPVLDVSFLTAAYRDLARLDKELCATGMWISDHTPLMLPVSVPENQWQVTYEIIFGHAFAPALLGSETADNTGEVKISLSHMRQLLQAKK